jgi:hypothetical protein
LLIIENKHVKLPRKAFHDRKRRGPKSSLKYPNIEGRGEEVEAGKEAGRLWDY